MKKFKSNSEGPNYLLTGKGFHVSYNPITDKGPETAIVKDMTFLILSGDYRKEYVKVVDKGYDECVKLFHSLIKKGAKKSHYSN